MKKFKIIVDSLSSMTPDICEQLDVEKLPYAVSDEDGKLYHDDFSIELLEKVTGDVANKHPYKTGMYQPALIQEKIDAYLKEYNQVIYICSSAPYTGQYEATKNLQDEYPGKVFVVDSKCTCTFHEEITYAIIEHFKTNDSIDINTINDIVDHMYQTGCMVFIPQNIDGVMYSGRVPATLVKLLKLAKVTPVIRVDDKNKPAKIIKHKTLIQDVAKMFNIISDIYKNSINESNIKKIYIVHTAVAADALNEIIQEVCDFFKVKKDIIEIRLSPLPIATYTLKDSLAISVFTDNIKKVK